MIPTPTGVAWLDAFLVPAALVLAVSLLWKPVRGTVRVLRRVGDFLEDWFGRAERPGVPGRAGVMERLERLDWHVGNGSAVPLRQVVEDTNRTMESHLHWADEQSRTLNRLASKVGLEDLPEQSNEGTAQ